ncbi:hypothetical protein [Acanthopleuribacter pedis]|uniref:Uncharacterized protein n=1 Tax=Acanthopleuribacter pedis TaxID=442870 RepID=A0A8J7QB43_9BACT|nr:hypothetical protein [Acanthopleuribacter pedis]MBO1322261.1 hypothetical protein [Acanthopleuribacter pedis]
MEPFCQPMRGYALDEREAIWRPPTVLAGRALGCGGAASFLSKYHCSGGFRVAKAHGLTTVERDQQSDGIIRGVIQLKRGDRVKSPILKPSQDPEK